MNCAICKEAATSKGYKVCLECWRGLQCFHNDKVRLQRAISYLSVGDKPKKQRKAKRNELRELIRAQKADARDQRIRFEHAISK